MDALRLHETHLQRVLRTNIQALAWAQPEKDQTWPTGNKWSTEHQPSEAVPQAKKKKGRWQRTPSTVSVGQSETDELQRKKDDLVEVAKCKVDELKKSFCVPVTRQQWEEETERRLPEFRAKMATVVDDRRKFSQRLYARPNLPSGKFRFQPQAVIDGVCHTEWARNLLYRTGWHAIKTQRSGILIVFLMHMHRRTHYLRFRQTQSASGEPPHVLVPQSFNVADSVTQLSQLEVALTDDVVTKMWELSVSGRAATSGNIRIDILRRHLIEKPAPTPAKAPDDDGMDDGGEEDIHVLISDADKSDVQVVGTDVESDSDTLAGTSSEASSDESDAVAKAAASIAFLKLAVPALSFKAAMMPTAGPIKRSGKQALWSDDYFWIADTPGQFLHIKVRARWRCPPKAGGGGGLGGKGVPPYGQTTPHPRLQRVA